MNDDEDYDSAASKDETGEEKLSVDIASIDPEVLDVFWYRILYELDGNHSFSCCYFPSKCLRDVYVKVCKYKHVYMTREISTEACRKLGISAKAQNTLLTAFRDMWIGQLPSFNPRHASEGHEVFANFRARLLLSEIQMLGPVTVNAYGQTRGGVQALSFEGDVFNRVRLLFLTQFKKEGWIRDRTSSPSRRASKLSMTSRTAEDYFVEAFSKQAFQKTFPRLSRHVNPFDHKSATGSHQDEFVRSAALHSVSWGRMRDGEYIIKARDEIMQWSYVEAKYRRIFDFCVQSQHIENDGNVRIRLECLLDFIYRYAPLEADFIYEALQDVKSKICKDDRIQRDDFVQVALLSTLEQIYADASEDKKDSSVESLVKMMSRYLPEDCENISECLLFGDDWSQSDAERLVTTNELRRHASKLGSMDKVVSLDRLIDEMQARRDRSRKRRIGRTTFVNMCMSTLEDSYDYHVASSDRLRHCPLSERALHLTFRTFKGDRKSERAMSAFKSNSASCKLLCYGRRIVEARADEGETWSGERARCTKNEHLSDLIQFAMAHAKLRHMKRVKAPSGPMPPLRGSHGLVSMAMNGRCPSFSHTMQVLETVRTFYAASPNTLDIKVRSTHFADKRGVMTRRKERRTTEHTEESATTPPASNVVIIGSMNGQLQDLLSIFTRNKGLPSSDSDKHYVFLGNVVGECVMSCETFLLICELKRHAPDRIDLLRGRNESRLLSSMNGLMAELRTKYSHHADVVFEKFQECFDSLPLAAVVSLDRSQSESERSESRHSPRLMLMHGGLFKRYGVLRKDLDEIMRVREPPCSDTAMCGQHIRGIENDEDRLFECALFSSPGNFMGASPNESNRGVHFGLDKTADFCWQNRMLMLIQSAGSESSHNHEGVIKMHYPQEVSTWGGRKHVVEDTSFRPLLVQLSSASDAHKGKRGAFLIISASHRSLEEGDAYEHIAFTFKTKRFHSSTIASFRLHGIIPENLIEEDRRP